jgi:hypothetical protein
MTAAQAPNFTLKHILGHPVTLSDFRGRYVLLLFCGRESAEQARQIGWDVRADHEVDEVQIVTVLDLSEVSRMMYSFARGRIQVGYDDLVRETVERFQERGRAIPADVSEIVVLLPDWDGKVTASYGLKDVTQQTVAVLVGPDGTTRGQASGDNTSQQILALFG